MYFLKRMMPRIISNSLKFSIKVWLTGVLFPPIIFSLTFELALAFGFIIIGFLFSLPSLAILYLVVKYINKSSNSVFIKKIIIGLIGLILAFIPFCMLFYDTGNYGHSIINPGFLNKVYKSIFSVPIELYLTYCLTIIAGIIVFKLQPDLFNSDNFSDN